MVDNFIVAVSHENLRITTQKTKRMSDVCFAKLCDHYPAIFFLVGKVVPGVVAAASARTKSLHRSTPQPRTSSFRGPWKSSCRVRSMLTAAISLRSGLIVYFSGLGSTDGFERKGERRVRMIVARHRARCRTLEASR